MSRKKSNARRKPRKSYGLHQKKQNNKPKIKFRRLKAFISKTVLFRNKLHGFLTILGLFFTLLFGIYGLSTKISISPDNQFNPLNPDNADFIIANDSFLSLNDVNVTCLWDAVPLEIDGKTYFEMYDSGVNGKTAGETLGSLYSGEKRSFNCFALYTSKSPRTKNRVMITVKYKEFWGILKNEKKFFFDTVRNIDGRYTWKPQQLFRY